MYWLYFARDFYRASGAPASPAPQHHEPEKPWMRALLVAVVVRHPPEITTNAEPQLQEQPQTEILLSEETLQPTKRAAKRTRDYAVKSGPVTHEDASPLNQYLQRLSIDGDHAFGVWDEDAGFSMFSANFERVTGLSSGECAGHDWIHFIHHTQQYAVNEALLAALEGHDGSCLVQAKRFGEDAETRWLMLDIKAASKRQPSIMVMVRNLTEQKALEEALRETETALKMSDRSRAAFLSSMSHELRTPLNAIMGFSEMMKSAVFGELGNPTYKEYAKHIHESGSALLTKINDLLDIAAMDVGGLTIEEAEFHLYGMLAEAMEMHSHQAFSRQQQIQLDCDQALTIHGDRAKLMCAASHLITNALRHSGEGQEVTITVRVIADEGIIISVRDAGEGISSAQLSVIRDALNADVAYFNIESGGIGLGLSLTKELAQRHGGRVMIDSVRHHGTVVSMILPTERVISGMPQRKKRSN